MSFREVLTEMASSPLKGLKADPNRRLKLHMPEDEKTRDQVSQTVGYLKRAILDIFERDESEGRKRAQKKAAIRLDLPTAVRNPIYFAELFDRIPVPDAPDKPPSEYKASKLAELEGDLRLSSYRFDEKQVPIDIQRVSQKLVQFILEINSDPGEKVRDESAAKAIANGLTLILRENLERLDQHLLFRADAFSPEKDVRKQRRFSSAHLKIVWNELKHKLGAGELKPTDTNWELLKELGFLTEAETKTMNGKEKMQIERTVQKCLHSAWEYYEEIAERLIEAQSRYNIRGEEMQVDPRNELKVMSVYELLNFLFEKTPSKHASMKSFNDAQMVLILFAYYFSAELHPRLQHAIEADVNLRENVLKNVFDSDNTETAFLHKDADGNIVAKSHSISFRKYELRRLKTAPGLDKQRIWWAPSRVKTIDAVVEKQLLRPDYRIEDIHDIVATTFVLWDVTMREFQDQDAEPKYCVLAKQVGKNMGYHLREDISKDTQRSQLENGDFCVISKAFGPTENARSVAQSNIRIYGLTADGVPFEIQFEPRDAYIMRESAESPSNHDRYEERRALDIGRKIYRGTAYPRVQEVINLIKTEEETQKKIDMKKARRKTKAATKG